MPGQPSCNESRKRWCPGQIPYMSAKSHGVYTHHTATLRRAYFKHSVERDSERRKRSTHSPACQASKRNGRPYMSLRSTSIVGWILVLLLLASVTTAEAQNGTILGAIVDESQSALPGVTVNVTDPSTGRNYSGV